MDHQALNVLSPVSFHPHYQGQFHSLNPHMVKACLLLGVFNSRHALTTVKPTAGEFISGQNYQLIV